MPIASPQRYSIGVHTFSETLVIPQHRSDMGKGVPPPYLAAGFYSLPSGRLSGEDVCGTVFRFPGVKGQLIKTEYFGSGRAGNFWQVDNKFGNLDHRGVLCASATDFCVDGCAEIRTGPFAYPSWAPKPDPHGPDFKPYADGLCMEGAGHIAQRLRFYQIPGTAVRIISGVEAPKEQTGAAGIYDEWGSHLDSINIKSAHKGLHFQVSDSTANNIFVDSVITDGIVFASSGGMLSNVHVAGADRAVVFTYPCQATNIYAEAARIGTHITTGGVRINGLEMGPGTCWSRGVLIEGHYNHITGLHGNASADRNPPAACVEIANSALVGNNIQGTLGINGNETGVIFRGHRSKLVLQGDIGSKDPNATFLKVIGATTGNTFEIFAWMNGGILVDLADYAGGGGDIFNVKVNRTGGTIIRYTGGGAKYNLRPGTKIYINGDLQVTE
jgi:hypothetical protein